MKANQTLSYKVYYEKQGVDSLCGVHCINSLLQGTFLIMSGPYFNEISLSEIAIELDRKEHELMSEQGMTKDLMKFMKEKSGNVALDGNYSIQVLQCISLIILEALKKMKLELVSIDAIDKKEDLNNKTGFICNSSAHWIAIRKINGTWYNLNSLGMRLPEIISEFYLSAFMMSVKQCGFQIFSVEGTFPKSNEDSFDRYNDYQEWYPAKRIQKYQEKKMKRKGYTPNVNGGGNDRQMEKALALSMGQKFEEYQSSGEDSDWENDKKKEVKPFSGTGVSMGGSGNNVFYEKFELDPHDVELITIMKMTIEDKLREEVKNGIEVVFRFPDGKKKRHTFKSDDPISNLYDFVWVNKSQHERFYLVDMGSKNKLEDLDIPLLSIEDPDDHTILVTVTDV